MVLSLRDCVKCGEIDVTYVVHDRPDGKIYVSRCEDEVAVETREVEGVDASHLLTGWTEAEKELIRATVRDMRGGR